jgi:hypothetical protein
VRREQYRSRLLPDPASASNRATIQAYISSEKPVMGFAAMRQQARALLFVVND